jgi:hypothetical protein
MPSYKNKNKRATVSVSAAPPAKKAALPPTPPAKGTRDMVAEIKSKNLSPAESFKALYDVMFAVMMEDPLQRRLWIGGEGNSWGDVLMDDPEFQESERRYAEDQRLDRLRRPAYYAALEREQEEHMAAQKASADAEKAARAAEAAEAQLEFDREEASRAYWSEHCCKCTMEDWDALPGGAFPEVCPCYRKIHLDANGQPEECRFFNSPAGCRDGDQCIYKHTPRALCDIPCRFEATDAGCRPMRGKVCPYKHEHAHAHVVAAAAAPAPAAADGWQVAGGGCSWRGVGGGGGSWRRPGGGGSSSGRR